MNSNLSAAPPIPFFLLGARLGLGIWLLYIGLLKWLGGAGNFVGYITTQFAETWSPAFLNTTLGWLIIIAEPLAGLWLLSGKKQRLAWTATALLMFLLFFGVTMLKRPDGIYNFLYFVFCLVCAALAGPEEHQG
jgi:uncharacterized membrane protein YphA (DoxX/SURF4 family)